MSTDIVTGRNKGIQKIINLIPKNWRLRLNPRRYAIESFVRFSAKNTKPSSKVLDAGAGPCPYKPLFKHTLYESTDFEDPHKILDFTCSLDKIPRKKESYDSILCTEVLEHVEYPQKVVNELFRVLKKDGNLYLTTPQEWKLHQEPHNYYYFTKYGLNSLLKNAGFKQIKIYPQGGYFWFLGDAIRFAGIANQYKKNKIIYYPLLLFYPLTQIICPFILFHLDWFDRRKEWTMGYSVIAKK